MRGKQRLTQLRPVSNAFGGSCARQRQHSMTDPESLPPSVRKARCLSDDQPTAGRESLLRSLVKSFVLPSWGTEGPAEFAAGCTVW